MSNPYSVEFMLTAAQRKALKPLYERARTMPKFSVIGYVVRIDSTGRNDMNGKEKARFALCHPEGHAALKKHIKKWLVKP